MITLPYQGLIDQAVAFYNRERRYQPKVVQSSLFFRDENFGIDELAFDLLIDESHSIEFDIAEHAVENGSSVSDHINERLRSVQVTGLFTNHPINWKTSGYVNEDGSVNRSVDAVKYDGNEMTGNRSRDLKLDQLKKLARERKPVRLVTSLEVYEEMVVESLSYDRGPDDGESIKFTIKLREIKTARLMVAKSNAVWNPPSPKSQETEAQKKMADVKKGGKVTGVEKTEKDLEQAITGEFMDHSVDQSFVFEEVEV